MRSVIVELQSGRGVQKRRLKGRVSQFHHRRHSSDILLPKTGPTGGVALAAADAGGGANTELMMTASMTKVRGFVPDSGSKGKAAGGVRRFCAPLALAFTIVVPTAATANEAWPQAVTARYKLRFQGIDVGTLDINTSTAGQTYSTSGGAKLAVMFGAFKVRANGAADGVIAGVGPKPKSFSFDWQGGKKKGATRIGFEGQTAKSITLDPPLNPSDERVPLLDQHKVGALDPVSAVLALTQASGNPCQKQVAVFDGKHRFDLVFSPKRIMPIPSKTASQLVPELAHVCRIIYRPVAGHKVKGDTAHFSDNRDMEIVLRAVPGTALMVPHAVYIPTQWGTASMVIDRVDVTTRTQGRIALTE
jgi:hypothetical protein